MKKFVSAMLSLVLCLMCLNAGVYDKALAQEAADMPDLFYKSGYEAYLEEHKNVAPGEPLDIPLSDFFDSKDVKEEDGFILTGEESSISWKLTLPKEAMYAIELRYMAAEGKSNAIEREVLINGEIPFTQASAFSFSRVFSNSGDVKKDSNGNEYYPDQAEVFKERTAALKDSRGYYAGPLLFYFKEGENTITLNAVNEPMKISGIRLFYPEEINPFLKEADKKDVTGGNTKLLEGEEAKYKSDATLYPLSDRSSSITSPQSLSVSKINTIGGANWSRPRQSLTWEFTVTKTGYYDLYLRCRQNYNIGMLSNRTMYIDGEIPFAEALNISVPYNEAWQNVSVPGKVYLTEGETHILTLENTVGEIAPILSSLQESVNNLYALTRKVRLIVGMFPDANRDYGLENNIPDCVGILKNESARVNKNADRLFEITKDKGAGYAEMQKLFIQLQSFAKDVSTMPVRIDSLETNIGAVAQFVLNSGSMPLLIDYIAVADTDAEPKPAQEGFFKKLFYEAKLLFLSFFSDYDAVSGTDTQDQAVELWLSSGRDQALVMKNLIDNTFTAKSGIGVSLRLVQNDVLLPAVAVGKGPDVAIGQEKTMPVNYGIRNALYDLSQFDDLKEILNRFAESAYESYSIGEKLYALPETQEFMMLYMRKDILAELKLEVPNTWEELYRTLYILQKNDYDVGLPNLTEDNIELYLMFLFQSGGEFYDRKGSQTLVDTSKGLAAFDQWVDLYTKYKITQKMDAFTRFRTGQAPLVLAPTMFYNQLSVSAPEIDGLWDVTTVFGTKTENDINKSEVSTGTGAVIFNSDKDKRPAWEFLKWWTSKEIQAAYSREMEILQGPAGRVPTANLEAFEALSWPKRAAEQISAQRKFVKGLSEVPGSYVVNRYMCTAARYAVNTGSNKSDIIFTWNKKINSEIESKRKEFNMD